MSRESLKTKYTTEYQKAIIERYADDIPETENGPEDYEKIADFYFVLEAPEQYENEPEMITYFNNNPDATVKDLLGYFDKITPDGLPPCAFEWDDD